MTPSNDEFLLTLENPHLRDLLKMRIHRSIIYTLREAGALPESSMLTEDHVPGLKNWAADSPNPNGQRAALARAIAELITVGEGARLEIVVPPATQTSLTELRTSLWQ